MATYMVYMLWVRIFLDYLIHFSKDVAEHFSGSFFFFVSFFACFALRPGAISASSDHIQRPGTLSLKPAPHYIGGGPIWNHWTLILLFAISMFAMRVCYFSMLFFLITFPFRSAGRSRLENSGWGSSLRTTQLFRVKMQAADRKIGSGDYMT